MQRKLPPDLEKYFDQKLKGNGLAQKCIETKGRDSARILLRLVAEASVGILEQGGNNKGPLVELMQKTADGKAQREPWCASAVQSWIAYCEKKCEVVSPIFNSEHCLTIWAKTSKTARVQKFPAPGAVIIWQHGHSQAGHTGIFIESPDYGLTMRTVEGNTSAGITASGKVVREGGGVYLNKRSMVRNGSMRVIGFLKPF